MEIATCSRLHAETVDKRDVTLQSPNLEKEGFVRSLQFLLPKLSCKEIVTDSLSVIHNELGEYTSVELYAFILIFIIAAKHPVIFHSLDIWNKSKKMRKALIKVTFQGVVNIKHIECTYRPVM